jgi:hypothetical protein
VGNGELIALPAETSGRGNACNAIEWKRIGEFHDDWTRKLPFAALLSLATSEVDDASHLRLL